MKIRADCDFEKRSGRTKASKLVQKTVVVFISAIFVFSGMGPANARAWVITIVSRICFVQLDIRC